MNCSSIDPLHILHLDDNPRDRVLVADILAAGGIAAKFIPAQTRGEFEAALVQRSDLILCDYTMPLYSGTEALMAARQIQPDTPFIFVSGTIGEERAVESLLLGATDYVHKNHLDRLVPVVRRALIEAELRRMTRRAEACCFCLTDLGFRLSAAMTAGEVAEIMAGVAETAVGWDAVAIHLCSAEAHTIQALLTMKRVDGQRAEVSQRRPSPESSSFLRKILRDGPQLLLRSDEDDCSGATGLFGDPEGRAASLMCAPICHGARMMGALSVQSYSREAYSKEALQILQVLADHGGATLERIAAQEQVQASLRRLDHLLDQSPAVLYALRLNEKQPEVAWVSSNIEHLLGFSAAEAYAPGWWSRQIHPQDQTALAGTLRQLSVRNQISRDLRIRHKNGEDCWVRDEQYLINDARGEPLQIAGSWFALAVHKTWEDRLPTTQKREPVGQFSRDTTDDFNKLLADLRDNAEQPSMTAGQPDAAAKEGCKRTTQTNRPPDIYDHTQTHSLG